MEIETILPFQNKPLFDKYKYPEEKPREGEVILLDLGIDEGEFRWWLCIFFPATCDKHPDGLTTLENGNDMSIPTDTGEEFVWYRLSGFIWENED